MDSVQIFGYRERPERYFLRTAEGSTVIFEREWWVCHGFGLKLNYTMRCPYQVFFEDGALRLTIFLDEEMTTLIDLGRVPNCASIHNWICGANQLFARQRR